MSSYTPEQWTKMRAVHGKRHHPKIVEAPAVVASEATVQEVATKEVVSQPRTMPDWVVPIALIALFGFILKYYK